MLLILVFLMSFNSSFADSTTVRLKPRKGEEVLCGYKTSETGYTGNFMTVKASSEPKLLGCPTVMALSGTIKDQYGNTLKVRFPVTGSNIAWLSSASTVSEERGNCIYKIENVELTCDKSSF